MYATAAARSDGLLLLCGGRDANGVPLGDAFGLARHRDGRWEWAAAPGSMPVGRYQHGAVFVGARLHISGGAVGGGRMVDDAASVAVLDTVSACPRLADNAAEARYPTSQSGQPLCCMLVCDRHESRGVVQLASDVCITSMQPLLCRPRACGARRCRPGQPRRRSPGAAGTPSRRWGRTSSFLAASAAAPCWTTSC